MGHHFCTEPHQGVSCGNPWFNSVWSTSQKGRKRLLLNGVIQRNSGLIVVSVYRNSRVQGPGSLRRNGTQLTTVGGASQLVHCLLREKCPKLLKYSETHLVFLDQFRSAVKSLCCVIYFTVINSSLHACLRTMMLGKKTSTQNH